MLACNAGLKTMAQAVPAVFLGLSVDPAVLNARIDARVDQMLADGLVEEVRSLLRAGFREGLTAPQAIGYKEVVAALEGACSLDDAVAQIKIATHPLCQATAHVGSAKTSAFTGLTPTMRTSRK